MPTNTTNLNLEKRTEDEQYDVDVANLNLDKIDTAVGARVITPSTEKAIPVDADSLVFLDSAALNVPKKLTWANLRGSLAVFFENIFALVLHGHVISDVTNLVTTLSGKQATLISGANIKTINGSTILASGDLELLLKNNPTATGTQTLPNIVTNGIKFPAAQVPSADPNTLDDYEEGTFLPTLIGTTTAGAGTYTTQLGKYTKIGSSVRVDIYIALTAHTGTGDTKIGGLPFGVNNGGVTETTFIQSFNYACPANTLLMAQTIDGTNTMLMLFQILGGGTWGTVALDTNTTLLTSISYKTN